jgi:Bacterial protein of unknown function (DUF937)
MATLFDSLSQALTPDVAGQIGKIAGLDTGLVSQGMAVAGPLVAGALAKQASSPSGLDGLMRMLPTSSGAGLGSILGALTGSGNTDALQAGLFGGGINAIGATIDKALGFKVSPLLPLAIPFVLTIVRQRMTTQNLDQAGVAWLLQDEQATFARAGGRTAEIVQSALDAGAQAVATKAMYPESAWTTLRLAPVAAAQIVMGASPSGAIGQAKELTALSGAITAAKKDAPPTSLVGLIFESALSEKDLEKLGRDQTASIDLLKNAMGTIAKSSPAEAAGYGKFLVDIATSVAEASKEGGFLGLGGTRVSGDEKVAIDQIRAVTGLSVV